MPGEPVKVHVRDREVDHVPNSKVHVKTEVVALFDMDDADRDDPTKRDDFAEMIQEKVAEDLGEMRGVSEFQFRNDGLVEAVVEFYKYDDVGSGEMVGSTDVGFQSSPGEMILDGGGTHPEDPTEYEGKSDESDDGSTTEAVAICPVDGCSDEVVDSEELRDHCIEEHGFWQESFSEVFEDGT